MVQNISVEAIEAQRLEREKEFEEALKRKQEYEERKNGGKRVEFNPNHYLNVRLAEGETERYITIRLLPFSKDNLSPFQKVKVHLIQAMTETGAKKWKYFMCPVGNGKSDKCPFCETSQEARRLKLETTDESKRKKYNEIEFQNSAKDFWMVRCIERGHEDEGPKYWRFPDSRKRDGIYDKLDSLYKMRKQGGTIIYDLMNGKDIIITVKREKSLGGKDTTNYFIQDADRLSPLSTDEAQAEAWINDPLTLDDVYSTKSYDYLSIVVDGKVPVWSKNLNQWIAKDDADKIQAEAKAQQIAENLMAPSQDFSQFAVNTGMTQTEKTIIESNPFSSSSNLDDLPF